MAATDYDAWLARGREHLWAGRAVDAMLCFERAATLRPDAGDPRFHLGEIHWALGEPREALAAWRGATRASPSHFAPRVALAEALLHLGEYAAARDAAGDALALAPGDRRARVLQAVARVALDELQAWTVLAPLAAEDVAPFASPTIAATLAQAWRLREASEESASLAAALAPAVTRLPWALLPCIARDRPSAATAVVDEALSRPIALADLDTLRLLAIAVAPIDASSATRVATRYAAECLALCRPPVPLLWPRRGEGPPRVALLVAGGFDASPLRREAIARGADVVVWRVGAAAPAADERPLDALPADRRAAAIAADDPDVLIDAVRLAEPVGPLLAQRPARRIAGVATASLSSAPPLVDLVVDADALRAWLDEAVAAATREAPGLSPPARAQAWDEAVRAHQSGEADAARSRYDALLAAEPGHAPAHYLRGVLERDAGDVEAAAADFVAALDAAPDYVEARLAAARLASRRGDVDGAVTCIEQGLARNPYAPVLWRGLGELQLAARRTEQAADAFAQALAIDPKDAEAHYNVGVVHQTRGDAAEAARAYQRALVFRPEMADAHYNLGVLFQEQRRTDAAVTAYGRVLASDPRRIAAWRNLGETLLAAGRVDAFIAHFHRFEAACPDALALAVQALEACHYAADFTALDRYLDGLRDERFKALDERDLVDSVEQLLYLLLFFDVDPDVGLRFAKTYDEVARKVYGSPLPSRAVRAPGRLRIGYLSADLRNHVMGKMMYEAIARHDAARFDVRLYSTSSVHDAWTDRFAALPSRFESVASLDDAAAAARIADDDLDLLVDLSTHTKGARPGILARKPARVQLTHVASAGTVGLSAIDFKLTDRYADVPENQAHTIETLLPMEGCVYPWRAVPPANPARYRRAALGIPSDAVVIGAFVAPLKLSRRCLALWREVLMRVPQALLAFSPLDGAWRPVYLRLVQAAGIDPARVLFLPQSTDDAGNQARYAIADFVLDPMPFGGVNGVLEPLAMGVPIVALLGRRHGERSAYSILANLGVTQTVAQAGREYVDVAVRLATDAVFAREVREAIAAGLARSPLVDMDSHARHLEAAYVEAIGRVAPDALRAAAEGSP